MQHRFTLSRWRERVWGEDGGSGNYASQHDITPTSRLMNPITLRARISGRLHVASLQVDESKAWVRARATSQRRNMSGAFAAFH